MADQQPDVVHWRGINHLALVTSDMDATVRFYHGVLGARLVTTIGTPTFRHYFFEFGPQNTVAFFEYTDVELDTFAKPAGIPDRRASSSIICRSTCPTTRTAHAAGSSQSGRMRSNRCSRSRHDPIGVLHRSQRHRARSVVVDARRDGRTTDYRDERFFADSDPVAAVLEIRETGDVRSVPHTHLV